MRGRGNERLTLFGGPTEQNFYEAIVAAGHDTGLEFCLDPREGDSYSSGQKWLDLTSNGFDFFVGSDASSGSDDPTFTGTPGGMSSSEYWSFDGGDYFRYDTTNEAAFNAIHKNNAIFAICGFVYFGGSASMALMATRTNAGSETGFLFGRTGADVLRLDVLSGGSLARRVDTDNTVSSSAWHFIAVRVDEAAGTGFFYVDGAYSQVSSSDTFTATYSSPATGAASGTLEIGAYGGGGAFPLPNNSRLGPVALWEGTAPTKANLDDIWDATRDFYGL